MFLAHNESDTQELSYYIRYSQRGNDVFHTAFQPIPIAVGVTSLWVLMILLKEACRAGPNGEGLGECLTGELLYLCYRLARLYTPETIASFFPEAISAIDTATPLTTKEKLTEFIVRHSFSVCPTLRS